ncbi:hypothetical protein OG792_04535 [Micromonospora sp. NBC_01699]|uniref:hypothetical protein n=1 Tax=Micromonospora sp. NBC_01699 TaxID=2975984 RepID=UPI002E3416E6|nr:hypothetical protein [Micromonospora sp. NBC_01699]
MRRSSAPLGLAMMVTLAACAQSDPSTGSAPPESREDAFQQRATEVATAWQTQSAPDWRGGYVPLQDPTVVPAGARFGDDTKQAFAAGWYRERVALPAAVPADGTITFPDGTLTVPLVSAADAYRQLDQGDPPPCPDQPAQPPPAPAGTGPDGSVSGPATTACTPLTVTRVEPGTTTIRTSRGEATVPAWLFTVDEIGARIARVAVAPSATGAVPEPAVPAGTPAEGLVGAQDMVGVDGLGLTYRLGVGACDKEITPLVREQGDLVLVGGTAVRSDGMCTEQLLLQPVTVTLEAPLAARTVLDAVSGRPLILTTAR